MSLYFRIEKIELLYMHLALIFSESHRSIIREVNRLESTFQIWTYNFYKTQHLVILKLGTYFFPALLLKSLMKNLTSENLQPFEALAFL